MELIDQHTKKIMEGCKERARNAGLVFDDETLEYIVTNRDLLELSPKLMIPTLYDYWVHDVEVLKEKGRYELYPNNPYETVINTRPAISFYNDNNPDWLNVMIFYHVLAHIDFFQNNIYYRHTWDYDFTGQALSDKRLFARLRSEKGRWVDYTIEFARSIDNIVGYYKDLSRQDHLDGKRKPSRLDYYFDLFLQSEKKVPIHDYVKEIERYNKYQKQLGDLGEKAFFSEVTAKHPEFETIFEKYCAEKPRPCVDLLQFIMEHSRYLNQNENTWMNSVLQVVRKTSIFFQPQIRTKIMNEGWASYWHEKLFLQDDRISGHEVEFARVNAGVTALPRVGLNPYALGMRLFQNIEDTADKGRYSIKFRKIFDSITRETFDLKTGKGKEFIFKIRETFSDFLFANTFIDQDFVNKNKLFVAGRSLNQAKTKWQYYVKSRNAGKYRDMVTNSLYHPPHISIDQNKNDSNSLYLVHHFEGKPLVKAYIENTMIGIEHLWGGTIHLETTEPAAEAPSKWASTVPFMKSTSSRDAEPKTEINMQRVLYTMENRKLTRKIL
ncbi:MAG: SpoVR family protein [Desulfobacterales bacterium]